MIFKPEASALYIPRSDASANFHRDFITRVLQLLKEKSIPAIDVEKALFSDGSPLYLTRGYIDHVLMMLWNTGDNASQVILDLFASKALTQHSPFKGKSTRLLGALFWYLESRQDKSSLVEVPYDVDPTGEYAEIASQVNQVEMLAQLMSHIDYLITLDLHSREAALAFEGEGIAVIHLSAHRQFANKLLSEGIVTHGDKNVIAMSTDLGSLPKTYAVAQLLGVEVAILEKNSISDEAGTTRRVEQTMLSGNPKGKTVIFIDDMISGGGTGKNAAEKVLSLGAKNVIFLATHAVFVGDYYKTIQKMLANPKIRVIVTNTLPIVTDDDNMHAMRIERRVGLPYVFVKNGHEKSPVKRYAELLDLEPFMIEVMLKVLSAHSIEDIIELLKEDILELEDPYDLFEKITGTKLQRKKVTHVYMGDGVFIPLYEESLELQPSN
ncbi:MAG: phosphoribosyltransferase family protein [Microgenomates group bacterium]